VSRDASVTAGYSKDVIHPRPSTTDCYIQPVVRFTFHTYSIHISQGVGRNLDCLRDEVEKGAMENSGQIGEINR
jgi:hypothetical protein